jgi:hypothetical protein
MKGSMSGDARDLNNIETRAVTKYFFFFFFAEGNSRHSDRNIWRTCTNVCHRQHLGGPVYTWWFFFFFFASSWTTHNSDHLGDDWSNSQANLGRPPDFGYINSWETGHLTWAGWVHQKIWTYGSSPRSGSRNAWTRIKNVNCAFLLSSICNLQFFRRDPNDLIQTISCWARLVTVDETWLYHYDSETKQQSMVA